MNQQYPERSMIKLTALVGDSSGLDHMDNTSTTGGQANSTDESPTKIINLCRNQDENVA
jgi:hypothetical protein